MMVHRSNETRPAARVSISVGRYQVTYPFGGHPDIEGQTRGMPRTMTQRKFRIKVTGRRRNDINSYSEIERSKSFLLTTANQTFDMLKIALLLGVALTVANAQQYAVSIFN